MVSEFFDPLVGQTQAIELLLRAVHLGRIAPAYLFAGPDGVGRRLAALGFAQALLSQGTAAHASSPPPGQIRRRIEQQNHPDVLWVTPTYLHQGKLVTAAEAVDLGLKRRSAPQIRLEQIRQISRALSRPPLEGERLVVVVEQAETMAEAAANGLLKTLEEPGKATILLLAPDSRSLLPTLVSRCQLIPFIRLNAEEMTTVLTRTGYGHLLSHPEILTTAQGSPGQAIAQWEHRQAVAEDLLAALAQPISSLRPALDLARRVASELDSEQQAWLVDHLQNLYWRTPDVGAKPCLEALEQARRYLQAYVQPRLVWEVTLMQLYGLMPGGR